MEYIWHILFLIEIYAILTISFDLLLGHTGIFSAAHAALYGLGAYTAAILATNFFLPLPIVFLCAALTCAVVGVFISLVSLRLHGDYFIMATFAFQIGFIEICANWTAITGGPFGIKGILIPDILGIAINTTQGFVVLGGVCLIIATYIHRKIVLSPYGMLLWAIRDDEILTQSFGKAVTRRKVEVYTVSAALASLSGVLFAYYISFVDPSSFTIQESIIIVSMAIIAGGGDKYWWKPVLGAALLVSLTESLRFFGLMGAETAKLRLLIYSALLIVILLLRPHFYTHLLARRVSR